MRYEVEFKPRSVKDLDALAPNVRQRILAKVEVMRDDLAGDVKRLTNYTPEYRLRVGDYRVLFEIEPQRIVIYRVLHRSKAYRD
jgi:mRNA interferase RelE/StbE